MSLGELVLRLKIDDRAYNQGMRDAKRQAEMAGGEAGQQFSQGFGRSVQSNQNFFDSIFQGIGVGIGVSLANAAGRVFRDTFKNVLEIGTFFEGTEASFLTALKGDAEATKKLLQEVQDFAATTTFSLRDVSSGSTTLLLADEDPEQLIDTLDRLGNIAAGAQRPLQQLLNVYRDVKVAGEAVGGDKLQLKPFIPANLIQEFSGEDEKLQFEELQAIIRELTEEGGRFFGLLDAQAQTVAGKISNLGDSFDAVYLGIYRDLEPAIKAVLDLMLEITQVLKPEDFESGLFAGLAAESEEFAARLKENPEAIASITEALENGLNQALGLTGELLGEAIAFLEQNPTALADAVNFGVETFRLFFDIVTAVLVILRELTPILQVVARVVSENSEAVKVLLAVWAGYIVISKAAAAFNVLSGAVTAAQTAMVGMNAAGALAVGGWLPAMAPLLAPIAIGFFEINKQLSEYNRLLDENRGKQAELDQIKANRATYQAEVVNPDGALEDVRVIPGDKGLLGSYRPGEGVSKSAGEKPFESPGSKTNPDTAPLDPPKETSTYIPPGGIEALGSGGGGGGSPSSVAKETKAKIEAYEISLVDLGRAFERAGFRVREHSQFGDGSIGRHSPNSYHYSDEALDITHHHGSYEGSIALTRQARNLLKPFEGAGFSEILGPGDPGHDEHLHLAAANQRITAVPSLLRALSSLGVSLPPEQLKPVSVSGDFGSGIDLQGLQVSAAEQQRKEQRRILEDTRRRQDERTRQANQEALQSLSLERDRALAEFDLETAGLPQDQRGGRSELKRLTGLDFDRRQSALEIDQSLATLEQERSRKVADSADGQQVTGRDISREIEFLKMRKALLDENFVIEAKSVRAEFSSQRAEKIQEANDALDETTHRLDDIRLQYEDDTPQTRYAQALKPVLDRFLDMKKAQDERMKVTQAEIRASELLGLETSDLNSILQQQIIQKEQILALEGEVIGKVEERIKREEEALRLERRSLEGQFEADILDATAGLSRDPYEAGALREKAELLREQIRYEQELFDLRGRYGDQPSVFEKLSKDAEQLNKLNIEGIKAQFKSLGETIGEEVGGALEGFGRSLITLRNPLDAFRNLLGQLVDTFLNIAFKSFDLPGAFSGIFGRDGAEIPSFINGGEAPYKPILGFFHGGEQILSDTTGEAAQYRKLQGMYGPNPLSSLGQGAIAPTMGMPSYSAQGVGGVGLSVSVNNNLNFSGEGGISQQELSRFSQVLEERMALTASAVYQEQFRSAKRAR